MSLYKPQGWKCGKTVAAYSPEFTIIILKTYLHMEHTFINSIKWNIENTLKNLRFFSSSGVISWCVKLQGKLTGQYKYNPDNKRSEQVWYLICLDQSNIQHIIAVFWQILIFLTIMAIWVKSFIQASIEHKLHWAYQIAFSHQF